MLPSLQWCRGFLAGIFDAEGSRSDFALRIANTDPQILAWTRGVRTPARVRRRASTDARTPTASKYIRIRGGLSEHLRFFHLTDPAITRKRDIEGQMVKTFANLRVAEIEPLGREMPLYDITTGTGDFIANGVVSHNCFARPTHKYLDFDAGRDFEREIVVKVNAPELLRVELARPSWKGEHVALGTNTDPYQWVEGRYKLMPGIWEAMRDARNPVLGAHQIPAAAARPAADAGARRADGVHRGAVGADARRAGVAGDRAAHAEPAGAAGGGGRADRAGIRTGVLIAPADARDQRRAGAGGEDPRAGDRGRRGVRDRDRAAPARGGAAAVLRMAAEHRPDLVPRYSELYRRGAYAPQEERKRLARLVAGPDREPSEPDAWRVADAAGAGSRPRRRQGRCSRRRCSETAARTSETVARGSDSLDQQGARCPEAHDSSTSRSGRTSYLERMFETRSEAWETRRARRPSVSQETVQARAARGDGAGAAAHRGARRLRPPRATILAKHALRTLQTPIQIVDRDRAAGARLGARAGYRPGRRADVHPPDGSGYGRHGRVPDPPGDDRRSRSWSRSGSPASSRRRSRSAARSPPSSSVSPPSRRSAT